MDFGPLYDELASHRGSVTASYSRMQCLKRCPYQYHVQYELRGRVSGGVDAKMYMGKEAHKLFELVGVAARTLRGRQDASRRLDSFFSEAFDALCTGCYGDYHRRSGDALRSAYDLMKPRMLGADRLGVECMYALGADGKAGVCSCWLAMPPRTLCAGFVDFLSVEGGEALVVDYKNEPYNEPRNELVRKQVSLYAYMVLLSDPSIRSVRSRCVFLKDAGVFDVSVETREGLPELEDYVVGMFDEYRREVVSGSREPRRNEYCGSCRLKECVFYGRNEKEDEGGEEIPRRHARGVGCNIPSGIYGFSKKCAAGKLVGPQGSLLRYG